MKNWLGNRGIRTKFLLVIALMAALSSAATATAWTGMQRMEDRSDYMYSQNLEPIVALSDVRAAALGMRAAVLNAGMSSTRAGADKFIAQGRAQDKELDRALATYTASDVSGREDAVRRLKEGLATYRDVRDRELLPAALRHDTQAFERARDERALPAFTAMTTAMTDLNRIETASARAANAEVKAQGAAARRNLLLLVLIGLTLATAAGFAIAATVARPLRAVAEVLAALARGDLTGHVDLHRRDEVGVMAAALDTTVAALRDSISTVSATSSTLAGAAEELSSVNAGIAGEAVEAAAEAAAVSAAAEQITRSVQTVSAAAEQMGASIAEIAVSAGNAAHVTASAAQLAKETTNAMERLNESSTQIGNVLSMITSIASQTNLLALNATIEAARAGEAGKGFAVVANEVKDLAQATGAATQDVSDRVEAIQRDAAGAVAAIEKISEVISEINTYATTIASAVEEQTAVTQEINRTVGETVSGTEQIHDSIKAVAGAAQSTTVGVGEAGRASTELASMSAELHQVVARFTT